jgi:hypothetical protein
MKKIITSICILINSLSRPLHSPTPIPFLAISAVAGAKAISLEKAHLIGCVDVLIVFTGVSL